jgi:hypothetical protein
MTVEAMGLMGPKSSPPTNPAMTSTPSGGVRARNPKRLVQGVADRGDQDHREPDPVRPDEPQPLTEFGQVAAPACDFGLAGAVGGRRHPDADQEGRDDVGDGGNEQHVGGAEGGDHEAAKDRPQDHPQADDRSVDAVGPLDRQLCPAGQERDQAEAGRVAVGVKAGEHEHQQHQPPEFEHSGLVQQRHSGHGGRAAQVGQHAGPLVAQPVD